MEMRQPTFADEVPLVDLPTATDGSENYCYWGYDFERDIGFFAHLGRWSLDRAMWREQLYIFLPGGELLVHRGVGKGDTTNGPHSALQRHVCTEAGRGWTLHHHGPAMRYRAVDLAAGRTVDAQMELVHLDARFDGHLPAFFYPSAENTIWGVWHYEQNGRMSGTIELGGETLTFSGHAFRDHTRGPRNLSHFAGSNWMQGELPDGTGFALFEVWSAAEEPPATLLREMTLVTPDGVESATLIESPGIDSMDDLDAAQHIVFDCSRGRIEIVGTPRNTMTFSVYGRHEILLGVARGEAMLVATEQPLELSVNGRRSFGYSERCRRLTPTSPKLALRGP